jgi:hypothetical protein
MDLTIRDYVCFFPSRRDFMCQPIRRIDQRIKLVKATTLVYILSDRKPENF